MRVIKIVVKRMKARASLFTMQSKYQGAYSEASMLRSVPTEEQHSLPKLDPGFLYECGTMCLHCFPQGIDLPV